MAIEHLSLRLGGRQILDDICLPLPAGGATPCVGLLGANGAGKSSLFRCITGMERRYTGRILLDGKPLESLPPHARTALGVSFLAQESWLFWDMTLEDNLLAIAELLGLPMTVARKKMEPLLEEFHLGHVRETKARYLSGGEMRRLEICRTLLREPALAIFDEPFAGLDPKSAHELSEVLTGLKARGLAMIISDHQVERIFKLCNRAILLDRGRILLDGDPRTVREHPDALLSYLQA